MAALRRCLGNCELAARIINNFVDQLPVSAQQLEAAVLGNRLHEAAAKPTR